MEEHLYKNTQRFPRQEPGIKQGTWQSNTSILSTNHTPTLVWISKDHIPSDQFWEAFAPDSLQEQREQVRRKYNKEHWILGVSSLQALSLQAYSTQQYRSIDSIEIVLKLENQQDLYHRVIIEDSRGLPIKYSSLEPYSSEEIYQFVNRKYQDWYRAGGYFYYKFYRAYPTFWIDLWEIVVQEYPIIIEWYLPEVAEEDIQATQEEEEESEVK